MQRIQCLLLGKLHDRQRMIARRRDLLQIIFGNDHIFAIFIFIALHNFIIQNRAVQRATLFHFYAR